MSNLPTLLIIDDEPCLTRTYTRVFKRLFNVLSTNSTVEALELLERGGIDVCTSDWRMPDGGGPVILKAARIPVVIITATAEDMCSDDVSRAAAVLDKPCAPEVMLSTVKAAIHGR